MNDDAVVPSGFARWPDRRMESPDGFVVGERAAPRGVAVPISCEYIDDAKSIVLNEP